MKRISISIRRRLIHKDFNSVLPRTRGITLYLKKIYDQLKRKIEDFAI